MHVILKYVNSVSQKKNPRFHYQDQSINAVQEKVFANSEDTVKQEIHSLGKMQSSSKVSR
jgi:hypothetical protein